jgi:hypothetical protein
MRSLLKVGLLVGAVVTGIFVELAIFVGAIYGLVLLVRYAWGM